MTAFLASLFFVVLAEMGDKTQLLAMAFAARYTAAQVLWAVFLATVVNHACAVVVGTALTKIIPLDVISLAASISFIVFGLWTLHGDTLDDSAQKESKFGPVVTVAIAFFLAEMGDKTQLATISLAVKYQSMFSVLAGTTAGMVIADAIGIGVGVVMKKHIPENIVKWISAVVFMGFGFKGVYTGIEAKFSAFHTMLMVSGVFVCTGMGIYVLLKRQNRC